MTPDAQNYEIWDDKQRLTVTLHEEHLPAFLRLAYGSEYRGHQSHGNHRRYLVGMGHEIRCYQGLPLVMRTYHLGLKGAMLLSNHALDLIQQVVGDHGPTLLPFTSALYASRHNPARASIGRIHGKVA